MAATSGRSRSRHRIQPGVPGPVAEHKPLIMTTAVSLVVAVVLLLAMTSQGRDVAAGLQKFLLYYAGVFTLVTLTASVGAGLVATDRVFMTPGHRVLAQAIHRAISFSALGFLVVHIVTEILAQRVHVIDSVVPFLSPFRRFYIGIGTLSADLIVLLIATSIVRKRFTGQGKAWRWRAVHYLAYLSFASGVLHGLMAGRTAKPYVDWSYGAAAALVGFGVFVRVFATVLRPKESLSAPPAGRGAAAGHGQAAAPLHMALSLAQAGLGRTTRMLPAGPGPLPRDTGGFAMLGAPPFGDDSMGYPRQPIAALPAPAPYEPGYLGPPRYEGAPRGGTGPLPVYGTGPQPVLGSQPRYVTGPQPVLDPGSQPPYRTGPQPVLGMVAQSPYSTGPQPLPGSGPQPPYRTGPQPAYGVVPGSGRGPASGSFPRVAGPGPRTTGPLPRATTGPMPRAAAGPLPRAATGPMPRAATGPMPRAGTGPMPRAGTGPMPRLDTGPRPGPSAPPGAEPDPGPSSRLRDHLRYPGQSRRGGRGGDQWR